MKLHAFLPSTRVLGITALIDHLGLACDIQEMDLSQGDQRTPDYLAKNPNSKIPNNSAVAERVSVNPH